MADVRIDKHIIKTIKLESDVDHLSQKVEKLCIQIDKSLPLLAEINLRMHDDISRRAVSEKLITKLVDNVREMSSIQISHSEKLKDHSLQLDELTQMSKIIISSKFYLKGIMWFFGSVILIAGGYYGYDQHIDRNNREAIELKQLEIKHEMDLKQLELENIKLNAEIEEKKKRLSYNREKYLIKNGVNHEK